MFVGTKQNESDLIDKERGKDIYIYTTFDIDLELEPGKKHACMHAASTTVLT